MFKLSYCKTSADLLCVDIGGTTPDPDFSVNEGKPRMHTTLACILQIDFAFASFYCIKWLESSENQIGTLPTLLFHIYHITSFKFVYASFA